jgi:hypothetical protein
MPRVRQRSTTLLVGLPIVLLLAVSEFALNGLPAGGDLKVGAATPIATDRASPDASPRASPVVPMAGPGSITVAFFGCPIGVAPADADTSICVPIVGGTGASVDSESAGILLTRDEATSNGDGSYTWADLPLGIYTVTDVVLPPGFDDYLIVRDDPDPARGESLARLRDDAPRAHFTVFGVGGDQA